MQTAEQEENCTQPRQVTLELAFLSPPAISYRFPIHMVLGRYSFGGVLRKRPFLEAYNEPHGSSAGTRVIIGPSSDCANDQAATHVRPPGTTSLLPSAV